MPRRRARPRQRCGVENKESAIRSCWTTRNVVKPLASSSEHRQDACVPCETLAPALEPRGRGVGAAGVDGEQRGDTGLEHGRGGDACSARSGATGRSPSSPRSAPPGEAMRADSAKVRRPGGLSHASHAGPPITAFSLARREVGGTAFSRASLARAACDVVDTSTRSGRAKATPPIRPRRRRADGSRGSRDRARCGRRPRAVSRLFSRRLLAIVHSAPCDRRLADQRLGQQAGSVRGLDQTRGSRDRSSRDLMFGPWLTPTMYSTSGLKPTVRPEVSPSQRPRVPVKSRRIIGQRRPSVCDASRLL